MDEPSAERTKRTTTGPSSPAPAPGPDFAAPGVGKMRCENPSRPGVPRGILAQVDAPHPVTDASPRRHPLHPLTWGGALDDGDAEVLPYGTALLVHGSFFLATCRQCEWTGSARRARHTALRDAVRHRAACPGPTQRAGDLAQTR